jgi:hypothetical protein
VKLAEERFPQRSLRLREVAKEDRSKKQIPAGNDRKKGKCKGLDARCAKGVKFREGRRRAWLAVAAEEEGSCRKEGRGGGGEQEDGVAVGGLDGGRRGSGGVEALGAAL